MKFQGFKIEPYVYMYAAMLIDRGYCAGCCAAIVHAFNRIAPEPRGHFYGDAWVWWDMKRNAYHAFFCAMLGPSQRVAKNTRYARYGYWWPMDDKKSRVLALLLAAELAKAKK